MSTTEKPSAFLHQLQDAPSEEFAIALITANRDKLTRKFVEQTFQTASTLAGEALDQAKSILNILAYALEQAGEPVVQGDGFARRAAWERQYTPTERIPWLYVAATKAYRQSPQETAAEVAASLYNAGLAFFHQNDFSQAIHFLEETIEHDLATNQPLAAIKALQLRGRISWLQGNLIEAEKIFEQAHSLAIEHDLPEQILSQLNNLGILHLERGNLKTAATIHQQVLSRAQATGYDFGVAMANGNLGIIALEQSSLDEAAAYFMKARNLYKQLGDLEGEATNHGNLGLVAGRRGHHRQAIENYQQAIELMRRTQNFSGTIRYRINIGSSFYHLGELDTATIHYHQALAQAKQLQMIGHQAQAVAGLGNIAQDKGQYNEAQNLYEQAQTNYQQAGNLEGIITSMRDIASVALASGEVNVAFATLEKVRALCTDNMPTQLATALTDMGNVHQIAGNYLAAQKLYAQALDHYRQQNDQHQVALLLHNLAGVHLHLGDISQTVDLLAESQAIYAHLELPNDSVATLIRRSQLFRLLGQLDEAEKAVQQAVELAREINHREHMVNSLTHLAAVQSDRGDLQAVNDTLQATQNLIESIQHPGLRGTLWLSLGLTAENAGQLGTALQLTQKGIEACQQANFLDGQAQGWRNYGTILMTLGDLDEAESTLQQSLELCEKMGQLQGQADNFGNLAIIAHRRNDWDKAAEYHKQALSLYNVIGYRRGQAHELCNIAYLVAVEGDLDEAKQLFQEALTICGQAGFRPGEAWALTGLGTMAKEAQDIETAVHHYQQALTIATNAQMPDLARILRTNLGCMAEQVDDLDQAHDWYITATETIEKSRRDLTETHYRVTYFAQRLNPYSRLVIVTWQKTELSKSLQWCEASRSRAFLDILNSDGQKPQLKIGQPLLFPQICRLLLLGTR